MTIVLDKWSLASSGLVGERGVVGAAAWEQVGLVVQSNLLGGFDLHDPCVVDGDLDAAKPDPSDRFNDLREGGF